MSEAKILETLVARFDQLDSKFEQIDKRFDRIEKKLDKHDQHFEQIDKHFDRIEKKLDKHDQHFVQIDKRFEQADKRFDKLVNILEEQNIELYNIKSTLQNHNSQFDDMGYTIKKIHNQTARLSIGQSELDMKIDKLKNLNREKSEKNINSI